MKELKKAYTAPEFELLRFKLENVLAEQQMTSLESPGEGVEEDLDAIDSGAEQ